jgi:hypothetical protein
MNSSGRLENTSQVPDSGSINITFEPQPKPIYNSVSRRHFVH